MQRIPLHPTCHVGVVPRFTSRRRWERGGGARGVLGNGMEWGPLLIVLRWVRLQSAESQVYIAVYIYISIYTSHIPSIFLDLPLNLDLSFFFWSKRAKIGSASGLLWQWAQHRHEPRGWRLCLGSSAWPGANFRNAAGFPEEDETWMDWSNKDVVNLGGVPKFCGIPQTQDGIYGFQCSTQTSLVDWWRKNHVCWSVWSVIVSRTLVSEWQCRSRKIEEHTSNSGNWLKSNCCVNFDFDPCHVSQTSVGPLSLSPQAFPQNSPGYFPDLVPATLQGASGAEHAELFGSLWSVRPNGKTSKLNQHPVDWWIWWWHLVTYYLTIWNCRTAAGWGFMQSPDVMWRWFHESHLIHPYPTRMDNDSKCCSNPNQPSQSTLSSFSSPWIMIVMAGYNMLQSCYSCICTWGLSLEPVNPPKRSPSRCWPAMWQRGIATWRPSAGLVQCRSEAVLCVILCDRL